MRLRYRYRLDLTAGQRHALARAFGCARVVYNDGLRLREDAYRAGLPYVSDGSCPGGSSPWRSGPRSGRGSVRSLRSCCNNRLPTSFAALSTGGKVANPRWLRQREKALRRSQRNVSRKQKGSKNREKARRRLAKQHVKVADARRDFHHQLSTQLIRENQTVCVEDLNVAALGRSNLAKSIAGARWGQFTAMLAYKADLYGRTVVRIDRWYPSSQLCSACGHRDGLKPLKVRVWTCPACGARHDRDVNAARNILAAGRAVTACGGSVRPGATLAVPAEAGTTPGRAA
jgi:IS605 OrfB family transposase